MLSFNVINWSVAGLDFFFGSQGVPTHASLEGVG